MQNRLDLISANADYPAIDHRRGQFDRLLAAHRERIVLYVYSLVHNETDAEDICQRASVVMWRKFAEFDRSRSFLAWACGVARYEALNHRRAASADRLTFRSDVMHLLAESLEGIERDRQRDRLGALRRCLHRLPQHDRTLLQDIYWNGNSCDTLAAELGCTLRTFYNRMYLLRRRLLRCIARRLEAEHEIEQVDDAAEQDHES